MLLRQVNLPAYKNISEINAAYCFPFKENKRGKQKPLSYFLSITKEQKMNPIEIPLAAQSRIEGFSQQKLNSTLAKFTLVYIADKC